MFADELSVAFGLLKAGPAELSAFIEGARAVVHPRSASIPALVWRVVQPSSGEMRGMRGPLLRTIQGIPLPDFAIDALASFARAADGEELLPDLAKVFARNAATSATATSVLLELALGDGPEAPMAFQLLAGAGADLRPHLTTLLECLEREPEAEVVALLGAMHAVSGVLPDDAVTLLCRLLNSRTELDAVGETSARVLLAGARETPAALESCLGYLVRLVETRWEVPEKLFSAFAQPGAHPADTGERLLRLFRQRPWDAELALALVVLAPSQVRATLAATATAELADDAAKRLLQGLAHVVSRVQKAPDLLSGWQLERFGVSIEPIALHAVDHAQPVLLRACVCLLVGLGDISTLARVFRYAESQGHPIDPSSFAEPLDTIGVTGLAPGWEQPAFWQAHLDHRASSEELLLLGEWYPSLRPLLARRLVIRGVTPRGMVASLREWISALNPHPGDDAAAGSATASARELIRRALAQPIID